jgi:hypothetical protein
MVRLYDFNGKAQKALALRRIAWFRGVFRYSAERLMDENIRNTLANLTPRRNGLAWTTLTTAELPV